MNKSKERVYLSRTRDLVLKIFDGRCVRCGRPTNVVHEIVPISNGKKYLAIKNRVPLCDFPYENSCHSWAHGIGTRNSIPILLEKRAEFLRRKWKMNKNLPRKIF